MEENTTIKEEGLTNFSAVSKFKSIKRAYRRGHVSLNGLIYPKRPFNNRTARNGTRPFNELKKKIYAQLGRKRSK